MNHQDVSNAKNPDLISSVTAMKRAAAMARQLAVQTGTSIVVFENEQIVWRNGAELTALADYSRRPISPK